jgi:formiminoglutamase
LEEADQQLTERVAQLIEQKKVSFVVGGGNDQSYLNVSALLKHSKSVYVINIDAHLDVRPLKEGNLAHSGSPFRQLLEDQRLHGNPNSKNRSFVHLADECVILFVDRFIEFASQGSQCSIEHVNYLRSKSSLTEIVWYQSIRDDPLTPFRSILRSTSTRSSRLRVQVSAHRRRLVFHRSKHVIWYSRLDNRCVSN